MQLTLINGTNRLENKSLEISQSIKKLAGTKTNLVDLNNFTQLFRGAYLTLENANEMQLIDLEAIKKANALIFVVPVYHQGMPGSLKNFFDMLEIPELMSDNVIGIVSANKKSRDGARQTAQVINGYISYHKAKNSFIVPEIPMIDPEDIDIKRLQDYLRILENYSTLVSRG